MSAAGTSFGGMLAKLENQLLSGMSQDAVRLRHEHADIRQHARLRAQPIALDFTPATPKLLLRLTNPLDTTVRVECAIRFTYPQVNSAGEIVTDSLGTGPFAAGHDLSAWVHGLPAYLQLAPHETRTLSLSLTVPPGVHDGEYWTTVIAVARGVVLHERHQARDTRDEVVKQWSNDSLGAPENLVTAVPLRYEQRVGPSTLSVADSLHATVLGDTVVRVCTPLQHTGVAHAEGVLRVALHTQTVGVDTVIDQPVSIYAPITPCMTFSVQTVPPGTYQVDVFLMDTIGSAGVARESMHAVLPFQLTSAGRSASPAVTADYIAHLDTIYSDVTLAPAQGPLLTQLTAEVEKANRRNRVPVLDLGATWCEACYMQDHAMQSPALATVMRGMYIIHIDVDQWGDELARLRVDASALPTLVELTHSGRPGKLLRQGTAMVVPQPGVSAEVAEQALIKQSLTHVFSATRAAWTSNDIRHR